MDVVKKAGQWPNVAVPAGSDPKMVMQMYGVAPPSVFDEPEPLPEPMPAQFGEWVDSQDDDGAVDDPGVDSREQLEADTWSEWFDPETRTYTLPGDLLVPNSNQLEPDSWERLRLEEAMHNVIRDALQNLQTAIMQCVEQGMDVLSFDEGEFVDYQHDEYVGEYLSRAMRLLDRQAAITEAENEERECTIIGAWDDYAMRLMNERNELQERVDSLTAERDDLLRITKELEKRNGELLEGRAHWIDQAVSIYRRFYPHNAYAVPDDVSSMVLAKIAELEAERDQLQKVVKIQAESFQKLERELKVVDR